MHEGTVTLFMDTQADTGKLVLEASMLSCNLLQRGDLVAGLWAGADLQSSPLPSAEQALRVTTTNSEQQREWQVRWVQNELINRAGLEQPFNN